MAAVSYDPIKSGIMVPLNIDTIPSEVVLCVLKFLDGRDIRAFGNTCRKFRNFILVNASRLQQEVLLWPQTHLVFGRKITLTRYVIPRRRCKRLVSAEVEKCWEFTEDEFLKKFACHFFVIAPQIMHIKCRDLDEHTAEIIKKCVGVMRGKTLAMEMDKCSLGESKLRRFFEYFSPFSLHIAGHFDRSIITDQVLPLSSLHSLFIGVNRSDFETQTRFTAIALRKIMNNWFHQDSEPLSCTHCMGEREYHVVIPNCELDEKQFFASLKLLTLLPRKTAGSIVIHNVSKKLIHAVHRTLTTSLSTKPTVLAGEGLGNATDLVWSCDMVCECNARLLSPFHNLLAHNLQARDHAQLCDTVGLLTRVRACVAKQKVLVFSIKLTVTHLQSETMIPNRILVDERSRRRFYLGVF